MTPLFAGVVCTILLAAIAAVWRLGTIVERTRIGAEQAKVDHEKWAEKIADDAADYHKQIVEWMKHWQEDVSDLRTAQVAMQNQLAVHRRLVEQVTANCKRTDDHERRLIRIEERMDVRHSGPIVVAEGAPQFLDDDGEEVK